MEEVISLDHVHKRLGQREILKDVDLAVNRGDIFGYLGPNGAGKTTSIRILLGLLNPTSGKASVLGRDVRQDSFRDKIGFVLEIDGLYDNMTGLENLQYYARLYGLNNFTDRVNKALEIVGLRDRAGDKVSSYSKGMRQRLALARAIVPDPEVLILDEPTSGVDPSGHIEIRRIMQEMAHKQGKTILLSSHNLDEVQRICNRIAIIHKGQIRLSGELERLQKEMGKGGAVIETTEPIVPDLLEKLQTLTEASFLEQSGRQLTIMAGKMLNIPGIIDFLVFSGVKIEQVKKQQASLEDIYTTIMQEAEAQP